ncbi:uncharacterized protein PV06_03712 [Exophiala oligosperma]|uniref:Uncharacterized protein n=1 Tax=Exophiala oligosperma TaxID=215243 RepID=A0A0D2EBE3_9EURO|nr:uncharacterized protein PV06_03712 [Exophiala oligosperma]KIW45314.1 hypothetical protein PV06_03712 [Exophiala oligosperma]
MDHLFFHHKGGNKIQKEEIFVEGIITTMLKTLDSPIRHHNHRRHLQRPCHHRDVDVTGSHMWTETGQYPSQPSGKCSTLFSPFFSCLFLGLRMVRWFWTWPEWNGREWTEYLVTVAGKKNSNHFRSQFNGIV